MPARFLEDRNKLRRYLVRKGNEVSKCHSAVNSHSLIIHNTKKNGMKRGVSKVNMASTANPLDAMGDIHQ